MLLLLPLLLLLIIIHVTFWLIHGVVKEVHDNVREWLDLMVRLAVVRDDLWQGWSRICGKGTKLDFDFNESLSFIIANRIQLGQYHRLAAAVQFHFRFNSLQDQLFGELLVKGLGCKEECDLVSHLFILLPRRRRRRMTIK